MELISIAAVLDMSNNYESAEREHQRAIYERGFADSQANYDYWNSEAQMQVDSKNAAQVGRIAAGTAAVGIWLWNTRDVKKNRSSDYSYQNKFSVGVNRYGQVEVRINF